MRARTARWIADGAAAGSLALVGGALALGFMDRHLVPASLSGWGFSFIFGQVVDMAIPVAGLVLASLA